MILRAAARYAETVEKHSDSELAARVYPLTPLNVSGMRSGLRDGMANAGAELLIYPASAFRRVLCRTLITNSKIPRSLEFARTCPYRQRASA